MSHRDDTCSAAPVPNPEKWSYEAIVAFVKCATRAYAEIESCGEFGAESRV
jgi:ferritin-like protein